MATYLVEVAICWALTWGPTSVAGSRPLPTLKGFGAGYEYLGESLRDPALHENPARRSTALAGGAECTPERAVEGELEVGVVEDDLGVFAAHFEGDGLEGGGGALAYEGADLAGSGKADGADVLVLDDGRTGVGAFAGDDVDDAGGQAGVHQRLDEVVGGERRVFGGLD